jgi:hypothetical protein
MKWLRARGRGTARHTQDAASDDAAREAAADLATGNSEPAEGSAESAGPHVMLLVHDAVGPAAYRLHSFPDARTAEEFVSFWFRSRLEHGILAFWATHWRPAAEAGEDGRGAEVVVLIRDEDRAGIVAPFSLPDMGLAQSWVAREAALGMDLTTVMIYWATPAKIIDDHWGRVRLTPREAPRPAEEDHTSPPARTDLAPFRAAFRRDQAPAHDDRPSAAAAGQQTAEASRPEPVVDEGQEETADIAERAALEVVLDEQLNGTAAETPAAADEADGVAHTVALEEAPEAAPPAAALEEWSVEIVWPEAPAAEETEPQEATAESPEVATVEPEPAVVRAAAHEAEAAAVAGGGADAVDVDIESLMKEMKALIRAWREDVPDEPFLGFNSPPWKF